MIDMFRFAYPQFLLLGIPLAIWMFWTLRKKPKAVVFSGASLLASLAAPGDALLARIPFFLRSVSLVLLMLAICRPQTYNMAREINSPGVDIILCIDASGTMQAMDFTLDGKPADRLTAVKKVVTDFIKHREHDRIALVVFGSNAFTQAPLTSDKGLLIGLVSRMEPGMAGDQTAIGDALALAGKRIKDIPAKSKIVILLTDGLQNAGDITPDDAASALAALNVKIYTIGVGGHGPAPFKVKTFFGDQIQMVDVPLDEDMLKKIAATGNGKYYRAADSAQLAEIYDQIDKAEKTEVKIKEFLHFKEKFAWFAIPVLILLLLEILLQTLWIRTVP